MKWMYFVVFCATVADQIHARPGPNEFTHSNSINVTEETTSAVPEIPSVFTKDDESIIRRYLQRVNNTNPKNIEEEEYEGSNNNILNNFLKISIDDLKQNRFTSIHSTIEPDSEPSKSYQIGIPNRYYEYEINEPEPGFINIPHNPRPQTAIFTNIKPVFELENVNPYPTRYAGVVRPTFVTTPTEATLISPLYHSSPTKVTKYHLITPKPAFNVRPTHRPYVNVYGYDPSDPDPTYDDDDYNQVDTITIDNGYNNNQPFNVKKKKKCNESPTNQYDPDCESFKLTLSQNVETTTAGHVIKIPNKGTSTHDNKLDLATFDEKQKDPSCNGGCCDGTCTEPYPPVPIPNRPFYPPLTPLPFRPPLPLLPYPTPNSLPLPFPQQIAPVAQAPAAANRPILSVLPSLITAGLTPLGLISKPKPKPDDDDDDFGLDFFDFDFGGSKFGFKKMMKKLWPLAPYLFALNPFSLGFWTVVISPVLLVVAGGTAFTLFLYPWVSKMLVQTRHSSSVVVHKHPGRRPPTPSPWRVSPHQGSGVKWTIKPKPKPFQFPRRKKRFIQKFLNNENKDEYGYDLMAYRHFRRF